ncbi:MAG: nucleotidyltransferase [Firmicutes bacterium HGW-Firmicutes-15]|nr:MAG: nucleotidyltransferase [Firmicutes bacterium HGW-Firmicutes-15]
MSVLSYLEDTASSLVLSSNEKSSITTSVSTIKSRIDSYFGSDVKDHFQFGSYTRDTILPRKYDERSDVDYIVIFKNPDNYKPQTLLNWLKQFAEKYYSSSEIYQSHPTMVLELSHIKFELVPAIKDGWGTISIPSPSSTYSDWMTTDPNGFNTSLTNANTNNSYKIKPLIRLMKYWNVKKVSRGYSSFLLEKWVVDNSYYSCSNLKDYFFKCIDDISYNYDSPQYLKTAIDNAKTVVKNIRQYEKDGQITSAENEIKKIIPEL